MTFHWRALTLGTWLMPTCKRLASSWTRLGSGVLGGVNRVPALGFGLTVMPHGAWLLEFKERAEGERSKVK